MYSQRAARTVLPCLVDDLGLLIQELTLLFTGVNGACMSIVRSEKASGKTNTPKLNERSSLKGF